MIVLGRVSSVLLKRMDKFDNISAFIFDVCRNESRDMAVALLLCCGRFGWLEMIVCGMMGDKHQTILGGLC